MSIAWVYVIIETIFIQGKTVSPDEQAPYEPSCSINFLFDCEGGLAKSVVSRWPRKVGIEEEMSIILGGLLFSVIYNALIMD